MEGEINSWIFLFSCYRNQLKEAGVQAIRFSVTGNLKKPNNFSCYLCLSSILSYSSQNFNKFQFSCSYLKALLHHVIQNQF